MDSVCATMMVVPWLPSVSCIRNTRHPFEPPKRSISRKTARTGQFDWCRATLAKRILAFFAASGGVVNESLAAQGTSSLLSHRAVFSRPCTAMREKALWATQWTNRENSCAQREVALRLLTRRPLDEEARTDAGTFTPH